MNHYRATDRTIIPPDVVGDIVEMLRDGVPVCDACRRAGVSEYAVRCIAKRFGITPVKARRGPQPERYERRMTVVDEAAKWRGLAFAARWRQLGE